MDFYDHGIIGEVQVLQLINLATQGFNAVVMLEDNGVLVRQAFFPSTTHAEIAQEVRMTTLMVTKVFHAAVMTIAKSVSGPEAYGESSKSDKSAAHHRASGPSAV